MRAVVLSGGGSKGAYEMGVWKALRKLHISYDIVTGTSVGALNAAFMVQKDYLKGLLNAQHLLVLYIMLLQHYLLIFLSFVGFQLIE